MTLKANHLDADDTADAMAVEFLHDCMPPVLSPADEKYGYVASMHCNLIVTRLRKALLDTTGEIDLDTKIKTAKRYACRVVLYAN